MVCLVSGYMGRLLHRRRLLCFWRFRARLWLSKFKPEIFQPNFERFWVSRIWLIVSRAVLVTRSGLVSITVCLVFGYKSRPLIGAAFVFGGGRAGFTYEAAESKETLAVRPITTLLRVACRGVFRGRLRLRRDSAARPFEPDRIMPTKETAGADCAFF